MNRLASAIPPWLPRWVLLLASIVGWGLFVRAMLINVVGTVSLADADADIGGMAVDTYAYWLAGANVAAGEPIYTAAALDELGAYFYPPPFAQGWVPLALLPGVIADWGWRILSVLSVRYMAGSWQMTGLWWLYPGSIVEITAGNVTFQVAALTVAGLRGRAEGVLPAAVVKFSTVAVVPFLWLRRPRARRGLVFGGVAAVIIVALSSLLGPDLWRDYLDALGGQSAAAFTSSSIIHILPTPAADFLLRIAIAAAVVAASVRFDSPHLAYVGSFLLTPTLWPQRFSVLFALLTLEDDDWLRPYRWPWRTAEEAGPAAAQAEPHEGVT